MNKITPSIIKYTEELKKLIEEHPDYPICVLAGEDANCGGYYWMYCSDISFAVGEILDCEDWLDYNDEIITDRGRLEEVIEDRFYDEYSDKSEEEYDRAIKEKMKELEPYWIKVIAIYATN